MRWKGWMICCRNMRFRFRSDALIYSFHYHRGKSKFPLWSDYLICNAVNLLKLPPVIVNVFFQRFHHWLPQTQGLIGISLDHQLGEIIIISSLPLVISYHVGFCNHLHLFLCFQRYLRSTHDVFTHHVNSTCTLSIPSDRSISRQYYDGQKGHLSICMCYSTLCLTMRCFRRSRTSMCFGASCYYKCTVYKLWWTCKKDWRLTVYQIWKETFLHRYRCLPHSTLPMHLSVATTNTAFVHVSSPLRS